MSGVNSKLQEALRQCQIVCFDVDSTVSLDEGIDVLAAFAGVAEQVKALTSSAMSGAVPFEDAIAARLNLIRPTRKMIRECLAAHPVRITPGAAALITALTERNVACYLVSGGFVDFVNPVAALLGVPQERVIANRFVFAENEEEDDKARCLGLDPTIPTSRSGGKAAAIRQILSSYTSSPSSSSSVSVPPPPKVAMIGDGITDLEAAPPADVFIGFGGVVVRNAVREGSEHYVMSFEELISCLS